MKVVLYAIVTVALLLSRMVTVLFNQNVDAASISTTRSNIKSAMKPIVRGGDNQVTQQSVIIKQSSAVDNNCGDGAVCSVASTNTIGDTFSAKSEVGGDYLPSISVDGNSNSFDGDPIPGVNVKLGNNPGGLP